MQAELFSKHGFVKHTVSFIYGWRGSNTPTQLVYYVKKPVEFSLKQLNDLERVVGETI